MNKRRINPVDGGYFVMEQQEDGTWQRIDFCEKLIDAQRQYPDAKIEPASPADPADSRS